MSESWVTLLLKASTCSSTRGGCSAGGQLEPRLVPIRTEVCIFFFNFRNKYSMSNQSEVCWKCSGKLQPNCSPPSCFDTENSKFDTVVLEKIIFWKNSLQKVTEFQKNQITWKYTSQFSLYIRWGKLWNRRQRIWRATEERKGIRRKN